MRVKVLYFGMLKEVFGVEQDAIELGDGASVATLLESLQSRVAAVPEVWRTVAVAVNREYSGRAMVLHEGDEVALLPPVSGGVR